MSDTDSSNQTKPSGNILLNLELRVIQLRRFDLPSADLDDAMIRVGDSAKMVVD